MSTRGGARPGAGRKPKATVVLRRTMAAEILSAVDEVEVWKGLIEKADYRTRLEALKYLTDRRDGKAPQAVFSDPQGHVIEVACLPVDPCRKLNQSAVDREAVAPRLLAPKTSASTS